MATPGPHPALPAAGLRSTWPWLLGLLVPVLAVYVRGLGGELVYDDKLIVGRNPLIADLANLPKLLVSPYWDFIEPEKAIQIGYWRPLTGIVHALSFAIGGGDPLAFHATGLAVHLAATVAAFFLALRLCERRVVAFFAALVFGLHPVQVEGVAWISALNDPLYGLFTLLSLEAFTRWRRGGSRGAPVAAWLWFVPALLTKELGVAVIPLAAAIDLGRRRTAEDRPGFLGGFTRPIAAYRGFFLILALYYLARMAVFRSPFAGLERVTTHFNVSALRLLLLRFELIGGSLELLTWPAHLNLFRTFEPVLATAKAVKAVLWSVGGVALCGWALVRGRRPLLAALGIAVAGLAPIVLRVESLGSFPLSERFLYVPALGFGLALALTLFRLLPGRAATAVLSLVVLGFGIRSFERVSFWTDEETLFTRAEEASPRSPYVLWGLGRVMLERYVETRDPRYLERAFATFEDRGQGLLLEARRGESDIFVTSNDFLQINLGVAWCYLFEAERDEYGGYSTARAIFEQLARSVGELREREAAARELGIDYAGDHLNLELVYVGLGATDLLSGDLDRAYDSLQKALTLNRDYPEAHHWLGRVFAARGDWLQARTEFERVLELRPGDPNDRILLAQTLQAMGEREDAEELAQGLVDAGIERKEPFVVLATLRLERGDTQGALTWLDRALAADPSDGWTWYLRAQAFVMRQSQPEAIQAFRRATELLPDSCEAHYDCGSYLLQAGAVEAGTEALVRAYEVCDRQDVVVRLRATLPRLKLSSADTLLRLGAVDEGRGDLELAESWLDTALDLAPESGPVHLARGRLLRQRDRTSEALSELRTANDLEPRSFLARSELGLLLADVGLLEEGLATLRAALDLPPPEGWTSADHEEAKQRVRERIGELESGAAVEGPAPPPGGRTN